MQTFLPYASFPGSARVLDRQRLGKQRVETLQILRVLAGDTAGWRNHPAVKMWRGHERVLVCYGIDICKEWVGRGYRDTCQEKIRLMRNRFAKRAIALPQWLGAYSFHASHRSNLLRKDPEYYGQFGWTEAHDLPYVWPVRVLG